MRAWFAAVAPILLAGCFTWKETPYPVARCTPAPKGSSVKVALAGFEATVTDWVPVFGYETVWVEGGPRHYRRARGFGHFATVSTETLVPQVRTDETYRRRASSLFEENGFVLRAAPADYNVEVTFEGPFVTDDESAVQAAWLFGSVLSAEYAVQTWTAKLKVYDNRTGRVAFHGTYAQRYENVAWSPLFFVGLAGYRRNGAAAIQGWCLSALTDRACAEATAFLAGK